MAAAPASSPPPASPSPGDPRPTSDREPSPDRPFLAVVAILGAIAFGLACLAADYLARHEAFGSFTDAVFVTPFWREGVAVFNGALPYRDLAIEYPPLSLPVFVLPALLPFGGTDLESYRGAFEVVVSAIGMALVPLVVATVARLGGHRLDVILATGTAAVSPLVAGSLAISRWDLWPALLAGAAVAALLWDRHRLGFVLLALGILAKVYPAVLGPIFVAWTWRRAGSREALIALGVGIAVGLAGLVPFLAVAPAGALDPFVRALDRPLQIESLGATILIALHDVAGLPLDPATYTFESFNLEGTLPATVAATQTLVLGILLAGVWVSAARRPLDTGGFVLACAAALCATVAFGKVLSPQFVLWLVPALAILAPVRGGGPLVGLVTVLLLTGLYYPSAYDRFVNTYELSATLVVLGRNLGLVLLAACTANAAGAFEDLAAALAWARHFGRESTPRG